VFDKKSLSSRRVKQEKAQFTLVNEHFFCELNAEIDDFLQRQNRKKRIQYIGINAYFYSNY
jgi:hypothetical protein